MLFFMGKFRSKKVEDGGYLWNGGDAYASKHANLWRGDAYLSAFEAIQIIIDFDLYTIELIALVVKLDKNDKKK